MKNSIKKEIARELRATSGKRNEKMRKVKTYRVSIRCDILVDTDSQDLAYVRDKGFSFDGVVVEYDQHGKIEEVV